MEEQTFIDSVRKDALDYNADKIDALRSFKEVISTASKSGHFSLEYGLVSLHNLISKFLSKESTYLSTFPDVNIYKFQELLDYVLGALRDEGFKISFCTSIASNFCLKISW